MLHPVVKTLLGYQRSSDDKKVLSDWRRRVRLICKPCWELKYCPYEPLVEQFPLPPILKHEAVAHLRYAKGCLKNGKLPDGLRLSAARRKALEEDVRYFGSTEFPDSMPSLVSDVSCRVFGHICPVFFSAEPLTETKDRRRLSRSIPRDVMLKVVRRDGQICQSCHTPVPDDQVEFDHFIPYSRGGSTTADNLRLLCRECNRKKRDSLHELLSPDPMQHLVELQNQKKRKKGSGQPARPSNAG